jgi:hypothetical protein
VWEWEREREREGERERERELDREIFFECIHSFVFKVLSETVKIPWSFRMKGLKRLLVNKSLLFNLGF